MFPNIPEPNVRYDLLRTGNVQVTSNKILEKGFLDAVRRVVLCRMSLVPDQHMCLVHSLPLLTTNCIPRQQPLHQMRRRIRELGRQLPMLTRLVHRQRHPQLRLSSHDTTSTNASHLLPHLEHRKKIYRMHQVLM